MLDPLADMILLGLSVGVEPSRDARRVLDMEFCQHNAILRHPQIDIDIAKIPVIPSPTWWNPSKLKGSIDLPIVIDQPRDHAFLVLWLTLKH